MYERRQKLSSDGRKVKLGDRTKKQPPAAVSYCVQRNKTARLGISLFANNECYLCVLVTEASGEDPGMLLSFSDCWAADSYPRWVVCSGTVSRIFSLTTVNC